MADNEQPNVMSLTVTLLSAYFANNTVPSGELPSLVDGTRKALLGDLTTPAAPPAPAPTAPEVSVAPAAEEPPAVEAVPASPPPPEYVPAVSIEESLASPDHLISLVDGKPYKTLKRHLASRGLTPEEYRARYGLAKNYPMTATSYSESRRAVAKALGLGSRRTTAAETPPAADPAPAPEPEAAAVEATPVKAKAAPKARGAAKAKPAAPPKKPAARVAKKPRTPKAAPATAEAPAPAIEAAPTPKRRRAKANGAATETPAEVTPES